MTKGLVIASHTILNKVENKRIPIKFDVTTMPQSGPNEFEPAFCIKIIGAVTHHIPSAMLISKTPNFKKSNSLVSSTAHSKNPKVAMADPMNALKCFM